MPALPRLFWMVTSLATLALLISSMVAPFGLSLALLGGLLALLWRVTRSAAPIPAPAFIETLPLVVYSLTGALLLYGVRRLMGQGQVIPIRDWDLSAIPSVWFDPYGEVYNKMHIRQGFLELGLVFIGLLGIALLLQKWLLQRGYSLRLHVATALLWPTLLLSLVLTPPYQVDQVHWALWIGIGLDVADGSLTFLHINNFYGLLPALLLAGITQVAAPFSFVTAYSLVALATLIAGVAVYRLLYELSQSKWIAWGGAAVLLFGFNQFGLAVSFPNSGALRFQMIQLVTLLLMWWALHWRGRAQLAVGVGLGLCFLWDPVFMAFAALPLAVVLLYRWRFAHDYDSLRLLPVLILTPLAVLGLLMLVSCGWPSDGLEGIYQRTLGTSQLFSAGWGGLPQTLGVEDMLWLGLGMLALAYLLYRALYQPVLGRQEGFLFIQLAFITPFLLYHLNRTSWISDNAVGWMMLPVGVHLLSLIYHSQPKLAHQSIALYLILLGLGSGALFNGLSQVRQALVGAEAERYAWANTCAESIAYGVDCILPWPDSFAALQVEAQEPILDLENRTNQQLMALCQAEVPLLSTVDGFIYLYGECDSQWDTSAIASIPDAYAAAQFTQAVLSRPQVVIDQRNPYDFITPFIAQLYDQWQAQGECQPYQGNREVWLCTQSEG